MQYSGLKLNDSSVVSDLFSQRGLEKGNLMRLRLLGIVLSVFCTQAFAETEDDWGDESDDWLPIPPLPLKIQTTGVSPMMTTPGMSPRVTIGVSRLGVVL